MGTNSELKSRVERFEKELFNKVQDGIKNFTETQLVTREAWRDFCMNWGELREGPHTIMAVDKLKLEPRTTPR